MNRLLTTALCAVTTFASAYIHAAEPASDAVKSELRTVAMDQSVDMLERIEAIKGMYPEMLAEDGSIPTRRICVWDIAGKNGPIYNAAVDQVSELMRWGVKIELDAYTSESVITEELKAGMCDAALFTGLRARLFNRYTGTLDAIGAVPSRDQMKLLMQVITSPKNAERMQDGQYVVMGYAPMGAAYIFVNDRSINTLAKAAGKRVAVLDYDLVQAEMVSQIGANPVPTSLVNAGTKFNNRIVDVLPAPLAAYSIMELYKGIGTEGGIVNYPFSQITLQLVGRAEKFPNELAQLIREDFFGRFDTIERLVKAQVGDIPEQAWIDIPADDKAEYQVMMQEARIQLREREYYDPAMLTLQRKIRCKYEPAHFECTNPVE
jgi:hypothetical protein